MPILTTIECTAVIVSALYGILLAARHGMDVVGLFTVACAVAFGGGTLRDLFLDRHPLFWIANPHYPLIVLCLALACSPLTRFLPRIKPLLIYPDALGMALFTVVGTQLALDHNVTWYIAVLFGVMTGTFGSVIGDIICNEIPTLFRPAPLNATCSLAGGLTYTALLNTQTGTLIPLLAGIATVFLTRLAAIRWNLILPAVRPPSENTPSE